MTNIYFCEGDGISCDGISCDGGEYDVKECDWDGVDCQRIQEKYPDWTLDNKAFLGDGFCDGVLYPEIHNDVFELNL